MELPKKLYYYALKGALSSSFCLLEMADARVDFHFCKSMPEWHQLRDEVPGRFPTGQLPAMELVDGTIVPESGAIKRTVAAALGKLGSGKDYSMSEALAGVSDDLKKLVNSCAPNVMNLGLMGSDKVTWSEEDTRKCVEEVRPKVVQSLTKIANMLSESKDRFTSTGDTLGEIDFFWTLHFIESGPHPGILGELQPFYARLRSNAGITRYIEGTGQYSTPQIPMWVQPLP